MEFVELDCCPITGLPLLDKITTCSRNEPPGYYAAKWEVKGVEVKEKQVRQKDDDVDYAERRRITNERNKRNYNPDKKHQYYLTRKYKIAQNESNSNKI